MESMLFDGADDGSHIPSSSSCCSSSCSSDYEGDVSMGRTDTRPLDSDLEEDIADQLDGIHFGATPPRQTRRDKQRTRPSKRSPLHPDASSKYNHTISHATHAGNKEQQKRHSQLARSAESATVFRKPAQLVRVDHKTQLRSIKLQRSILHGSEPRRLKSSPNLTSPEYTNSQLANTPNQQRIDIQEPRATFHKEISLLVKLGGKLTLQSDSFCRRSLSAEGILLNANHEPYHVAFDALLWLELKAWQAGVAIDMQDAFLETSRNSIDHVLTKVAQFNFHEVLRKQLERLTSGSDAAGHKSYVKMVQEKLDIKPNEINRLINCLDIKAKACDSSSASFGSKYPLVSTACCTSLPRSLQSLSMGVIRMTLDAIDRIEQLYPTLRELTKHHADYANRSLISNYKVLVMWLNMTKDLHHKLNVVARLVDIKESDILTWQDWYDHGLGLRCLKTQQQYLPRDVQKTTKDKHIPEHNSEQLRSRHSVTELTQSTTSRYRAFVEKGIHQLGLVKLSKRINSALHPTLWRANQALKLPEAYRHSRKDSPLVYTPSIKNVLHQHVLAVRNNPALQSHVRNDVLKESDFQTQNFGDHGVWGQSFQMMQLPSFLELYLFLCNVSFDIALECIRYRLEHKPKGEPSALSVKQLILECKEVIYGGVCGKEYYLEMTLSVLTTDDKERLNMIESKVVEFENDMQKMLLLYFDYLQTLLHTLQRFPNASESLKNVIEENWLFAKEICPHIRGAEAQAGYKFCVFTSGLLDSIGHYLESSLDECMSLYSNEMNSQEDTKNLILDCCRKHKRLFNEARQRSAKALGFAKMLHKDIGIAAEYRLKLPLVKILDRLEESGHVKVEFDAVPLHETYEIFVPMSLLRNERQILQLLSVICGFEDPIESPQNHEGYILIINTSTSPHRSRKWQRKVLKVVPTVDMKISLSKIQVDGLILIACNSYQLSLQRRTIKAIFGMSLEPISEQTSSHETISSALKELKVAARGLADILVSSVQQVHNNLQLASFEEVDEFEMGVVHTSFVETMHLCYSVGFEYLRELTRLLTELTRNSLVPLLVSFARMWMKFVTSETEQGRGTRPRWAAQGLDFLVMISEPQNVAYVDEEQFQGLRSEIIACIKHIVGQSDSGKSTPVYRASSPAPVYRNPSHPGSKLSPICKQSPDPETGSPKSVTRKSSSNSAAEDVIDSFFSPEVVFTAASPESTMSPVSMETHQSPDDNPLFEPSFKTIKPLERVRHSLSQLEMRRNNKLRESKAVGFVTEHLPDSAAALANVDVRKVSFKWQLGLKLGQGQFGQVFSCVNLDTGELMAMKQIRFPPNDYSAIQEIADEFKNIEGLKHESIVAYYGVEVHRSEMLIFMEYCADGTIADIAQLGLPESMVRAYSLQILKAIAFLHRNRIVHRDIKGANIFLSSDGLIKLGDFGSAVKLKSTLHTLQGEVSKTHGTTVAYMAPEVITEDRATGYGRTADIWSFGCVVVEMMTGKSPWPDCDNVYMIMYRVGSGTSPDVPDVLSDEGKEFLSYCFIVNPLERWTADMLENHAFVKVLHLPD